ncbi:MAG: hypothetical protein LBQ14_06980 [Treponema sp.]|jgi:hypothetical protein|nr:hypothetical protein [Treponema sp.]
MKEVIGHLETALEKLSYVAAGIVYTVCEKPYHDACESLRHAINTLKNKPRWETPEQYEKRTGEPWPDDWAVYWRNRDNGKAEWLPWFPVPLEMMKLAVVKNVGENQAVIATEAGPPPNEWVPE